MQTFLGIFLYIASFFVLWLGAGLIISTVDKISASLKVSRFALSFFLLGLLTSIPELAVGVTSVIERDPEIFAGNLIGGIIVIFLLLIPVLAVFGNGIALTHNLDHKGLIMSLITTLLPALFIIDGSVHPFEALLMILAYVILFSTIQSKQHVLSRLESSVSHHWKRYLHHGIKILIGALIVIFTADYIVRQTYVFSTALSIPPFLISLVALSLGTNLPEFSLAFRSIYTKKKEVAFGDYIGSATANTLLFGLLVFANGGSVRITNTFLPTFIITSLGLSVFYIVAHSKNFISRKEGGILLLLYGAFLAAQFFL